MSYLVPRFGEVAADAPHYESFYLTATHPERPVSYWIRHTVHQVPGAVPTASVWFTAFGPGGPRAAKSTVSRPTVQQPLGLVVAGSGSIDPLGARGAVEVPGLSASWDLEFRDRAAPFSHLSKPWMYRTALPRTKSTSPAPDQSVHGTVTVDGETVALDGWRGMVGHNWGSEHAHRWVWLRGAGFAEDPDGWLDVVLGRIKVAGLTTPWVANGIAELGGVRHRVGGALRYPLVAERDDGCDLVLGASGLRLEVAVAAPRELSVGWLYADPRGGTHQVRNCSIAGLQVTATAADGTVRTLRTAHGGVYELGSVTPDPELVVQPFGDG